MIFMVLFLLSVCSSIQIVNKLGEVVSEVTEMSWEKNFQHLPNSKSFMKFNLHLKSVQLPQSFLVTPIIFAYPHRFFLPQSFSLTLIVFSYPIVFPYPNRFLLP